MYQKKNRKKEIVRRTFVYATMVTTLVVALCVLLFMMLGYRFNPAMRTVEQAGLVQYNSFPRGAKVSIDSVDLDVTPAKNMVMPGQHQFSMKLNGYEPWQKTITIRSDTVTQLDYARLVPAERNITTVRDITGLETAKFSPSGRFMFGVGVNAEGPMMLWGDIRNADTPKFTEQLFDTTKLSGYDDALYPDRQPTIHTFSIHAWDGNGRFVLLKHHYTISGEAQQTQWIRLDREKPNELVDISAVVGFGIRDITFANTGGDMLYVLQGNGDVRRVRLGELTISRPLLTGVEEFSLYDEDTIVFIAAEAQNRTAGIWRESWEKAQVIHTLAADDQERTMHIRASRYFSKDTVVVSVDDTATIYRGTLPGSETALEAFLQTGKKVSLGRTATALSISDNGRFVMLRDAASFISYDLERLSLSAETVLRGETQLAWLDAFHVWHVDETGELLMQEFDGANPHKLLPATTGYDAVLSENGKFVYAFSKKDDALRLQRLAMTAQK